MNRPLALLSLCLGATFLFSSCLHKRETRRYPVGATQDPDTFEILESTYPENMAGIDYRIGVSNFRSDAWGSFGRAPSTGILYRSFLAVEPLELEIGGSFDYKRTGGGSNPLQRLRMYEFNLGLGVSAPLGKRRKTMLEPFFGGGRAFLIGHSDLESSFGVDHIDDADTGFYVHGGARIYLEGRQYITVDWRVLRGAELDLGNGSINANRNTLSIGFGVSF